MSPISNNFGESLAGFTLTFTGAVDPTSFSPADIGSMLGPNFNQIAIQSVLDVTPVPPAGVGDLHNIYKVLFTTPQVIGGNYTLLLGPNAGTGKGGFVTDDSGNLMNQNGNTVNGEVGTIGSDDRFQGTYNFVPNLPPVIMRNSHADHGAGANPARPLYDLRPDTAGFRGHADTGSHVQQHQLGG